jgi:hypothetical protein|nr:MAG TPA: asparaginyl-tRNA synthetase [Caudoviricetes sp.]
MTHEVVLQGYNVKPGSLQLGTFDSYGIEKIHVTADDEWAGLDILAVFHAPDGTATKVVVGANGMLAVPPEATAKQAGGGRIVFAGLAENVQRITVDMRYSTKPHSDIKGDNPGTPTPDVVQQILENSNHAVSIATAAQDAAENARQAAEDAAKKAGEGAGGAAASAAAAKKSAEDAAASSKSAASKAEESASSASAAAKNAKAAQTAQGSAENAAQTAADAAGDARQAAGEAAQSAEAAETAKQIAEDAAKKALEAKTGSENALQDAGAAKDAASGYADAAAEKATAAADSETNAAKSENSAADSAVAAKKSAEDADNTANSIKDSMAQISENKEAVSQLKEDLDELNKVSEKISSISIIQKCEVTDGYYWNFIAGEKETKEINENYITAKIPIEGNKLIVYGEFQDWASRYVNNGAYTPVESTYISHNTQTSKVAEFYNIPTDAKYLCLSFYKGGLDTSIESINVVSGEFRQNLSYRKTDFVNSLDVYTKNEVDDKLDKLGEIHINKIYVATTGSDTEGDGTKEKPYATVLKANDVITDASEKNKYEIIVADGTYTDLQEKYKGQNGSDFQGVIAKSYVTYKSQSNNPEKCIFIWDGGVGYDTISNDTCTNKCFFHINSVTINTVIKGFKFVGSNLRYCLHFESNCLTTPYIENCIFDWHGRDFLPKNGPVIGMGGSIFSHITFKDCKFLNSQNDAGIQWHDNTYPYDWINGRYEPEGLCPKGAVIECIDCLFDNLNIQVRSQNEDRPMPCCLIVKNCGGLKNVYPTIIGGGTKNYWKLFNQCSFIKNDLLTDSTETTTYDEMTSIKTSTEADFNRLTNRKDNKP